jgi:hypothetical protein
MNLAIGLGLTDLSRWTAAAGAAYDGTYISATGDDSTGDGTHGNPYRSFAPLLAEADGTYDDETIILMDDGDYAAMDMDLLTADNCTIKGSGTGTDRPYIDCTAAIPASWTLHAAGIYKVTLTRDYAGTDAKLFGNYFYNGVPMRKVESVAALSGKGNSVIFAENENTQTITLYMNAAADPGADGAAYRWSKFGKALHIRGRGNRIEGIEAFGPCHQDGSLVLDGDGADKATLGGNVLADSVLWWGSRHSAYIGSGGLAASIVEGCNFKGGADEVETGTTLNSTGTANAIVFNSPDHSTATCISRNNVYDGMGRANYVTGATRNLTGPYGHDGVAGRAMVSFTSEGDTYTGCAVGSSACATTNAFDDNVYTGTIAAFDVTVSNLTITFTNNTGTVDRIVRDATASRTGTINLSGNVLTAPDMGAGSAGFVAVEGASTNWTLNIGADQWDIAGIRATNISNATLIRHQAGALNINGLSMSFRSSAIILTTIQAGFSGGTVTYTGNNNTWHRGFKAVLNGTTYSGLAAWQAVPYDAASVSVAYPAAQATASFNTANANLEAVSPWSAYSGGAAGAMAVDTNMLKANSTTLTGYKFVDAAQFDRWARWTVKGAGTAGPVVAVGIVDKDNWFGVRWSSSQFQGQLDLAASFTQPLSSTGFTPTANDDACHFWRSVVDPVTGATALRSTFIVNDKQVWTNQAVTAAALNSAAAVGVVARSVTQNPWIDDLSVGPTA